MQRVFLDDTEVVGAFIVLLCCVIYPGVTATESGWAGIVSKGY
jgi:hypothetical protein